MELYIFYFYTFIIGTSIGSFINVVLWRLPREESIIFPRSYCRSCQTKLFWKDNIPIISWFFLKGQCRYCAEKISITYPIIEFLNGFLFFLAVIFQESSLSSQSVLNIFSSWTLISISISLFIFDMRYFWLPKSILYFGSTLGILKLIFHYIINDENIFLINLIAGFLGYLILFSINFVGKNFAEKNVIGSGDMKLIFMFGIWIGIKGVLISLYLSFLMSGVLGAVLITFRKLKRGSFIPFGPFLIISSLSVWFIGDENFFNFYDYLINYLI